MEISLEDIKNALKPDEIVQLKALQDKLKAGKILTAYEQKKYDSYIQRIEGRDDGGFRLNLKAIRKKLAPPSEPPGGNPFHVPSSAVYEFFGVTQPAFLKWTRNPTFPRAAQVRHGVWDLRMIFTWYRDDRLGDAEAQSTLGKERLKYESARARKMELEVKELEGGLLRRDEVLAEFTRRIAAVKAGLLALNRSLPPALAGKDPRQFGDTIKKHTTQLLARFSLRGGILREKRTK